MVSFLIDLKKNEMKKVVYNTTHGQLSFTSKGEIVLVFESLYMHLEYNQFKEFVEFVNGNSHLFSAGVNSKNSESFYHSILRNMRKGLSKEFLKLINVPIFSIDENIDIFDNLYEIKNRNLKLFPKEINRIKFISAEEKICLN